MQIIHSNTFQKIMIFYIGLIGDIYIVDKTKSYYVWGMGCYSKSLLFKVQCFFGDIYCCLNLAGLMFAHLGRYCNCKIQISV